MATGFLRQVFEIFERYDTPIDLIATSEVTISVTVDKVEHLAEIKADLARLGEVRILRETAIVSLVGRGFFRYQGLARRIFEALSDVNVVMISFAASDANVSVVVEEADTERAVHGLHREFFWKSPSEPASPEKSVEKAAGGRKNPKSTSLPR
jgi:aspartate kinase